MRQAYEALVGSGLLDAGELLLLDAWLADVAATPELFEVREARL